MEKLLMVDSKEYLLRGSKMGAKEKTGITQMGIVIVIAGIIIVAAVATAGWWFYLRPAPKKTSTIDLAIYSEVPNGENQTISGLIKPAVADATVTLTCTKPDTSTFNRTVTSDSDGKFTDTFTVDMNGTWAVKASWPGNSKFEAAESILKTFTVTELEEGVSRITCDILPYELERGEDMIVSGQIWTSPVGAGGGATVTLAFTKPDASTFSETVTSESDGSFTYTYSSETTDVVGWWDVTASWDGGSGVAGDTSEAAEFHILPVFVHEEPIKIGVIGPMEWVQGVGMREGGVLAAEEINEEGGILGRRVVIVTGDEGTVPQRGRSEMERLCGTEKVHFLYGGFRTEIAQPMREVAMDHRIMFTIAGSATDWLVDCGFGLPCEQGCVRHNYERYKYTFRATPPNTTVLFTQYLIPYFLERLVPEVLIPRLGLNSPTEKLKIAIVIEELAWTEVLRERIDLVGELIFGAQVVEIVSKVGGHKYYGVNPLTKDFTPILEEIKDKGTHLIFEVFSGEEGLAFIKQWRDMEVPAIPVGINVLSQENSMWDWTNGKCEYESVLATMGTRTPISDLTVPFWDAYVERWGHSPIYTSFGVYDGIKSLKELLEQVVVLDHPEIENPNTWEELYESRELYDLLIPYNENFERTGILGKFRYTKYHDIFTGGWNAIDLGLEDYVKPILIQWRKTAEGGRMVPVCAGRLSHTAPEWAPYIEDIELPPWMLD